MASIRTAYRTKGMRQARRILKRIEKLGEDRSELVEAIGQTLVESAQHRLAVTNEGPDGEKWPVSRRAMRSGGRTQFDSGMAGLAGSLTYRALPGGLEIGSPLAYAAQRQFGGTIRPKRGRFLVFETIDEGGRPVKIFARQVTQPARPYLGVSDADADEIAGLAVDMLDAIVAERGR